MRNQDIQGQILSMKQIDALLSSSPNDGSLESARTRAIMELLYSTGVTLKELITLKNEDIDFTGEVLIVARSGLRKKRIVTLSSRASKVVSTYFQMKESKVGDEPIFVLEDGQKISTAFVGKMLKKQLELAGLDQLNLSVPQLLRHNFAVGMRAHGSEWKDLQELLGHLRADSTRRAYKDIIIPE